MCLSFYLNILLYQYWECPLGVTPPLQEGGGVLHWSSRGSYKGATAITDNSISDPAWKLKTFYKGSESERIF